MAERRNTSKAAAAYERNKTAARLRSQENAAAGQDIGEIPPIADPERRARCENDFRLFCETYHRKTFSLEWSPDHLRVIAKIERVVNERITLAVAMPRGSGKSSLAQAGVEWAVLYGKHKFIGLIAATDDDAKGSLASIKGDLSGDMDDDSPLDDFPEVCYPIRQIDDEPRKCKGQRCQGEHTGIEWGSDHIVLPTIPGSKSSGAIIYAAGITGKLRGPLRRKRGGGRMRPTLIIGDDPSTDESARSFDQNRYRFKLLNSTVRGLAGPNESIGIMVPCTVIAPDDLADQLLDRKTNPAWHGERTRMVTAWPTNKELWEQYHALRDANMRTDKDATEARAFYKERQATCGLSLGQERPCEACVRKSECMDCGAVLSWPARKGKSGERQYGSALEYAMNLLYDLKEEGFASEYQNEPMVENQGMILTAAVCASRFNGRPRWLVPPQCAELVQFIDVHQELLYHAVIGFAADFTGYIVDYGTWPPQPGNMFSLDEVEKGGRRLSLAYPGRSVKATIMAGLEEFVTAALAKEWQTASGTRSRVSRLFVDASKWPDVSAAVKHKCGGATMVLYKGIGLKAGARPLSQYKHKPPPERWPRNDKDPHWYEPCTSGTSDFPYVFSDVNYWKARVHEAFMASPGAPGSLTIFGDSADRHAMLANHVTAEKPEPTHGHGRDLIEWTVKPGKPDNHLLDCLTGCFCAASHRGISPGTKIPVAKRQRQYPTPAVDMSFTPELG